MSVCSDILLDTLKYLELNEVERCFLVSIPWYNIIRIDNKRYLNQKRRIYQASVKCDQDYPSVIITF